MVEVQKEESRSRETGAALLEIEDLRVDYFSGDTPVTAVDGVSLSVRPGEIFGLAGESGSGKSTLAQSVLRILRPPGVITGGHVHFDGKAVLDMSESELRKFRWREMAMVMQSAMNALNPVMSIGAQIVDVIEAHESGQGFTRKVAWSRAADLLKMVDIDPEHISSYPHQLSGGMRQRVAIALALALKPKMLIMDEPTTALDVVVEHEIIKQIVKLRREIGFSVLFISHDLSLMLQLCDRVGVMYAGQLVECAPSSVILDGAKHPYTQGLMGAIPSLHQKNQKIEFIPGGPPDLRSLPQGCRFHPRCTSAIDTCADSEPALVALGSAHTGACHLYP